MANVRDSDTSLWLHNKLGTSNDSWISGSICSQLNKEVLRNIKECFPDLQTQVKLKLLLSFFHIPRRLVEEWKSELEEVIEVAGLDSELWVSMLAETMKTFPATSSLNTEISDYEETRPIFTDMVNDLRKMVSKHSDLGMLPLECQYLNKNALVSVVGQQQNPVKHFTLKRKPKSANLRTELLHKSADAQSSLKKASAPTIPLRSRGMPRKMTDTTPLKGIPSRVPTSGFRSPNVQPNQSRPNMSRTPAGRKDGGIKLIEFTEQPLGYAAAKKRKRQQELEEQQKKALEQKTANATTSTTAAASTSTSATSSSASTTASSSTATTTTIEAGNSETSTIAATSTATAAVTCAVVTPDYAPTLTYTQPPTPAVETMCDDKLITAKQIANAAAGTPAALSSSLVNSSSNVQVNNNNKMFIKEEIQIKTEDAVMSSSSSSSLAVSTSRPIKIEPDIQMQQMTIQQPSLTQTQIVSTPGNHLNQPIKIEKLDIKPIVKAIPTQTTLVQRPNALANLPNNISVKITSTKATRANQQQQQQQQQPILINSSTPVILSPPTIQNKQTSLSNASQQTQTQTTLKSLPLAQLKSAANSGPVIISQTIIQPAKRSQQNMIVSSAPAITSNIANTMVQTSSTSNMNNTIQIQQQQPQPQATQYIITSTPQSTMPSLASFAQARPTQQTIYQTTSSANTMSGSTQTPTKIVLKTASTLPVMMSTANRQNQTTVQSNPPPLISTQQPTILNIQNVNLPNRAVTIQPASHAAQQQHLLQQQHQQQHIQQQQQQHQQIQTHTVVSNTNATQQPKLTQVVMQSPNNSNVKGKTIILTQKGVILRNIGGDMYQQIPISNMSNLQNLNAGTIMTSGPPGLVKTTQNAQTIHVQQQQQPMKQTTQQLPALIPTNHLNQNIGQVVVQQQPQHQQTVQTIIGSPPQQTIIRPVMTQSSLPTLPQGLTLIQRHGQPTQLVQMQTTTQQQQQQIQPQQQQQQQQQQLQQQQIHRTILTQQPQTTVTNQLRPQQIILHHKPQQRIITTTTTQQALAQSKANNSKNNNNSRGTQIIEVRRQAQQHQQQQQQQHPQRKSLVLTNEHVHKAHEMFEKANRVSRPDKALILGFMAGQSENPRPNSENVIVIKLSEVEEEVQQEDGTSALCLVESLIRLDYNTGEWKTFQNYRRLDQNSSNQGTDGGMQSQNSVVI